MAVLPEILPALLAVPAVFSILSRLITGWLVGRAKIAEGRARAELEVTFAEHDRAVRLQLDDERQVEKFAALLAEMTKEEREHNLAQLRSIQALGMQDSDAADSIDHPARGQDAGA